jgi:hypothetical protein
MPPITSFTAILSVGATLLHVRFASFDPCTIGKHVLTHSIFSFSHNTFRQLSPLFSAVSAGFIRMRIAAFLNIVFILHLEICFVYLLNMLIKRCVIIDPALILYRCFEQCSVLGCWDGLKYCCVGGKGSSTKEHIYCGSTWERKRGSLRQFGRRGARWGNEIEQYYDHYRNTEWANVASCLGVAVQLGIGEWRQQLNTLKS